MAITFNSFPIQNDNYIITELNYRGAPTRITEPQKVTRRPGVQYVENEFSEKKIQVKGAILGDSTTDLKTLIDTFNQNVVRVSSGLLSIDPDRSINALVSQFVIEDPHYSQSYAAYTLEFTCLEPFFQGSQIGISLTVASGTVNQTITTVISGSVYAEPTLTYTAVGTTGYTTTSGISFNYLPTAQILTWSGTGSTLMQAYGEAIKFDYSNQYLTRTTVAGVATKVEPSGVFARWEPGPTSFTLTFSGMTQGGTLALVYNPRYI